MINWLKYPRTMQDAFGPYTSHQLFPLPMPPTDGERAAGVVLAVVGGIVSAGLLFHWIAL